MGSLKQTAAELARAGRGNDTILAHINPWEAAVLKALGGSGKVNPETGILEFEDGDATGGDAGVGGDGDTGDAGVGDTSGVGGEGGPSMDGDGLGAIGPDIDVGFAPGVNSSVSVTAASDEAANEAHDVANGFIGTLAGWLGLDMVGYSQPDETTGEPEMGFDLDFDPLGGFGSLAAGLLAGPVGVIGVGLGRAARGFANEDNVDIAHGFGQIASAVTGVPGLGTIAGAVTENAMGYNDFSPSDEDSQDDGVETTGTSVASNTSTSPTGVEADASGEMIGGVGDDAISMEGDVEQTAQEVANAGRYGDSMVATLSPYARRVLELLGGAGTVNPQTGLREYYQADPQFAVNPYVNGNNQGIRSNEEVGNWFRSQGYQGEFSNGAALNWARDNGRLNDYFGFIGAPEWNQNQAPASAPNPAPAQTPTPTGSTPEPAQTQPRYTQGSRTDSDVQSWMNGLGYARPQDLNQPNHGFQWIRDSGNLDAYADFILGGNGTGLTTGERDQGYRTNDEVGSWLRERGYQGDFSDGQAFRWMYDNNVLPAYAQFITTPGTSSADTGTPQLQPPTQQSPIDTNALLAQLQQMMQSGISYAAPINDNRRSSRAVLNRTTGEIEYAPSGYSQMYLGDRQDMGGRRGGFGSVVRM